jgi:hypothetical protein
MEIVNNHVLGRQSQIISIAISMDVPDLPDWIFELTPNRAKLYMQFRLDCAEYIEIFDDELFHQLFTDDTVDADDLEDASLEDYDAEEIAAAEKELISNPFEDDEVIDAAIGNDDGDDIEDIEESLNESLILLDDDDDF